MNLGLLIVALVATIAWSSVRGSSFDELDENEVIEQGHSRVRRDLTCSSEQTKITTPYIYVDTTNQQFCASAVSSLSNDFYNTIYRSECQRWLGLDAMPESVGLTSLIFCLQYPNNTVVYQMAVCCTGTIPSTTVRCFTNTPLTDTDNYGTNYMGTVQTCAANQLCQTQYTFQGSACTVSKRYITKGCVAATDCLSAASSPLCADFATTPVCTTCCNSAFCNLEINETLSKKPGSCSSTNTTAPKSCTPNPCNGGYCISSIRLGFIRCSCELGYTGTYCNIQRPICPVNYCSNGGTCFLYENDVYGYRCYCPPGFIGENCDFTNQLVCHTGDASYYSDQLEQLVPGDCDSASGSQPLNMQAYKDMCITKMKRPNGPTFVNGVNGQFSSIDQIQNLYCRHGDDSSRLKWQLCCPACLSVPCQNGGYCIDVQSTLDYVCSCPVGFTGKNCEHRAFLCVCSGEPHCITFDKKKIDYQGLCKHVLAEPGPGYTGPNQFHVYMRNEHRGSNTHVSFPKDLIVDVCNDHIELQRDPTSTAFVPVIIKVNGITHRPPYHGSCYVVDFNGPYMRVDTNFGLSAEFDGRWLVIVQVPGDYRELTHGVCGNNNGNATDDQTTCDGQYVGNYHDPGSYIGNSCVVPEPNPPTSNCSVPPNNQTCLPAQVASYTRRCSLMTNVSAEFGNCIVSMGLDFAMSYLDICVFDACFFNESSICDSLTAFAQDCFRNGFAAAPSWRVTAGCPFPCPVDMVASPKASPCLATCDNPTAPNFCPYPPTETCVCPNDPFTQVPQILFNGRCVTCCGCYDEHGVAHYVCICRFISADNA